jgi:hypothetical protein
MGQISFFIKSYMVKIFQQDDYNKKIIIYTNF